MAYGGNDLTGFYEFADDAHCRLVGAQLVGINLPSRQDEGIEIGNLYLLCQKVDTDAVAPVAFAPAYRCCPP